MAMVKIGWIGLGHMGVPMVRNLRAAGYALTLYNRTPGKAEGLGAALAASPAALAKAVDVVITMLADDAAQEAVLFGPGGVAEGLRPGQTVINMGTISPEASRRAAERLGALGVAVLDAPVSGSVKPATDGTLVILVGGAAEVVERCQPIFAVLGKKTLHFGGPGQGANAKLAINMLLGTLIEATAETVRFGEALGLERGQLLEMIGQSACASPIFQLKVPALLADDYPPAFPLKHMAKDFRLIEAAAAAAGIGLPAAQAVAARFAAAEAQALGERDVMAVISAAATP
ncbi:2-(hydroxymethyl)glutarate dehydrogenase [mine drainage metagenome]|uniref:2-(Hydroxymethyl)glutarate dehydrogenase n=1 Tax=mine drainage metagenome TaxID=410659 RepID=A0A1J5RDG6_9ZZZZ